MRAAAQSLVESGVDTIYFSQVSILIAQAAIVADVANEASIPFFANTEGEVRNGAAVAIATSHLADGELAGQMVAGVLDGTLNIADSSIERVNKFNFFINRDAASQQGIELPEWLIEQATDLTTE